MSAIAMNRASDWSSRSFAARYLPVSGAPAVWRTDPTRTKLAPLDKTGTAGRHRCRCWNNKSRAGSLARAGCRCCRRRGGPFGHPSLRVTGLGRFRRGREGREPQLDNLQMGVEHVGKHIAGALVDLNAESGRGVDLSLMTRHVGDGNLLGDPVITLSRLKIVEVFGRLTEVIISQVIHVADLHDQQSQLLPTPGGVQYCGVLAIVGPGQAAIGATVEHRLTSLELAHQLSGGTDAFFIVHPTSTAEAAAPMPTSRSNLLTPASCLWSRTLPQTALCRARLGLALAICGCSAVADPPGAVQDRRLGNVYPAAGKAVIAPSLRVRLAR